MLMNVNLQLLVLNQIMLFVLMENVLKMKFFAKIRNNVLLIHLFFAKAIINVLPHLIFAINMFVEMVYHFVKIIYVEKIVEILIIVIQYMF